MPHVGKGLYAAYDRTQVEKAASAVRDGLSLRSAAKKYGVPRSTISDRVTGKVATGSGLGRPPVFSQVVEAEIAEIAKSAAEKGIGLSKSQLFLRAGKLATRMNLKTPFNKKPGDSWWDGFRSRNVGIALRQPEPLCSNRSRMMNPIVVGRYMLELKSIITKHNLDAGVIWNCDETGINMQHKPAKVCARVGSRSVPGRVGNCRAQVTLLPCISAAGECMPPMLVVRGKTKRCLSSYEVSDGPTNAIWTYQSKAWMDDVLGVAWFRDVFLANCGPRRPQLLILDSHHSHETLELIEEATKNNIMILAMPPHTTHYLCPLDRTVFGPLQRHYNTACSDYMIEATSNVIDRKSLPKMIKLAYEAAFTRTNVVSGFEATGIYRWDPLKIPDVAFSPSTCTDEATVNYPEKTLVHDDDSHPLQWVLRSPSTASSNESIIIYTADEEPMEIPVIAEENFLPFEESDTIPTTIPTPAPDFLADDNLWNLDLQAIFSASPSPPPSKSNNVPTKRKSITSHRLLTSEAIIEEKQNSKEQKLKAEETKRQRKVERDLKRNMKAVQNINKV